MTEFFSPQDPDFTMEQQIRDDEFGRAVDRMTSEMNVVTNALAEAEWRAQTAIWVAIGAAVLAAMAFGAIIF